MGNIYQTSDQITKINYFWLDAFDKPLSFENQSPELFKSKSPHFSSDIWNLSLILYEITHNLHPFKGINNYETCQKIMKEEKIPFGSHITDDLVELFQGVLEKNSQYRWYFKEIFNSDWFKNRQGFFGFDIKIDLNTFNSPLIKKNNNQNNDSDGSDESIVLQNKNARRRKSEPAAGSAISKIQRNKTNCQINKKNC